MMPRFTLPLLLSLWFVTCAPIPPPAPYGAVPSERQREWHTLRYYAFIHFGPNTFTDREWGYGNEPESIFNPTQLDCRQWARVVKEAGMEGIIITAKHHDGFCLWPSRYTEHSVKNSPWKQGRGDVIGELRKACDEYGLKLGIYLSPWDRNHAAYGTAAYVAYYRNQLKELLTNYGEIFEVWFDGANGGDGYYGGARENRKIDNKTYYGWDTTWQIVRTLQPNACMFSDGGPDVRWIGNEDGHASETNWCTLEAGAFYPGVPGVNEQLATGREGGNAWVPSEVNTSIRPGWFYHQVDDARVKSLSQLIDVWYRSVGMNGNFLLNLPPDKRGLIHENDVMRLKELKKYLDEAFSVNLVDRAIITASNTRGNSSTFLPRNVIDRDEGTYWATDDSVTDASITLDLGRPTTLNAVMLQEQIALGQRVKFFSIQTLTNAGWFEVATGTTVGNRRIVRFTPQETRQLRISFAAMACPVISHVAVYRVPEMTDDRTHTTE